MPNRNKNPLPDFDETRASTPRIMRWGFSAVIAVIVLITVLSVWRAETSHRAMEAIVSEEQAAMEALYHMQLAARDRTFALYGAVHAKDSFVQDREIQRFYAQGDAFRAAQTQLMQLNLDETEHALLRQLRSQTEAVTPLHQRVIDFVSTGRRDEAAQLMIDLAVPEQNQVVKTLTDILDHQIRETRRQTELVRETQSRAGMLFLLSALIGVLVTWGILVLVTRKTSGLVTHLADTSERLQDSNQDLQFQKLALDEHNIVSAADMDGNITAVNDKFCEVSQYTREELLGQNHRLLKSDRHPSSFYDDLWATISAGKVWRGEICNRRKDGTFYWVASTILPFVSEDGLPSRYVSVRTDITLIKEAQLVLERSRDELEHLVQLRTGELAAREEVLRSITNAAQDAVLMIDPGGLVTYWNPAAERIFGFTESDMLGKRLHDMIVPERYLERHHAGFARFSQTGEGAFIGRTTSIQAKHKNGEELPVEIALSAVKLHGKWNAVGIVRDATERVRTEERLKLLATTDTLTGICNRRHFDEILASELDRAARFNNPLSLILFDIDHFKRVNDTFGHQTGDQVLAQLAGAVGGSIRTTDLFARWGGEEFIVLMPGSDINAAHLLAEKLRTVLENQPFPDVGQVTCSFGVAEYAPGDDMNALMKKADHCLYQAKASGRNRVEIYATPARLEAGESAHR